MDSTQPPHDLKNTQGGESHHGSTAPKNDVPNPTLASTGAVDPKPNNPSGQQHDRETSKERELWRRFVASITTDRLIMIFTGVLALVGYLQYLSLIDAGKTADSAAQAARDAAASAKDTATATKDTATALASVSTTAKESLESSKHANETAEIAAKAARKTAEATEKSVNNASDLAAKQLRPFMCITGGVVTYDGKNFIATLRIENTGQTPAHCVTVTRKIDCQMIPYTGPFKGAEVDPTRQNLAIGPKGGFSYILPWGNDKVTTDTAAKLNGSMNIWVFGDIQFGDEFEHTWKQDFKMLSGRLIAKNTWELDYAPDGNELFDISHEATPTPRTTPTAPSDQQAPAPSPPTRSQSVPAIINPPVPAPQIR